MPGNKSSKDRLLSEWCTDFKLAWPQSVIKLLLLTKSRFIDGSVLDCTVKQGGQINAEDGKMHDFFFSRRLESTFPPLNSTLICCFCRCSFFICISWRLRFLLHLCQEIFWPSHQLNTRLCLNSLHPKAAPRDDVFWMGLIKARSAGGAVTPTYHSVRLGSFWIKRFLFSHFRVIPVGLHAGEVLFLSYQVGVGWNMASGHLPLVACFFFLFMSPFHSRCFSISLWHHTLVSRNQMHFPGQHNMFRQTHTHTLVCCIVRN